MKRKQEAELSKLKQVKGKQKGSPLAILKKEIIEKAIAQQLLKE